MSQKTQRTKTLVGGVAILGIAGILSKVIGMLFRLPLTNEIGLDGMGIYQTVYNAYTMLLTISTAGIPVAISRMVSESVALGRYQRARTLLRTALGLLAAVGLVLTALLFALADPLSVWIGDTETAVGYRAIAPTILIVSLMAAFRGYLQGRSDMRPTAVSQLIEALGKLAISLPLARLGLSRGIAAAAAGALVGVTLGEALALLYVAISYALKRRRFVAEEAADTHDPERPRALLGSLVRIAIPITLGSMIVPLAGFIDTIMIRQRLFVAGFGEEEARVLYGALSGAALTLVNVPTVLATAVCVGLVPLIAAARVEKRREDMRETSLLGLRLGSLIGMPCTIGMSMLAAPLIALLYPGLSADEAALSARILSLSALTILFFTQVQASTGILQGAALHKIPMYSLVIGVGCKVALNYVLIGIPAINILGAPVASIVCYLVSMGVNLYWIERKVGVRIAWGDVLYKPGLATLGMAGVLLAVTQVLDMTRRHNTLLAVAAGGFVYLVLMFAVGALRRADMAQMPGGRKIERLMLKLRIWK
ncbi:MAG: polysaccharide biosynthesis protein [Oscillospiraceae bacterium]|jgi:stage V sporulation protein B|nr:polysaccharide biosynthesis protein [Oscillospiraceae bacterium]